MSDSYSLVKEFKGYVTKPDPTNTNPAYLVDGSFNVLINEEEKVVGRKGYKLFGDTSTDRNKVESAFTWETSSATEIMLRGVNNSLQAWFSNEWVTIADGFTTAEFGFPRSSRSGWWNTTESLDILPFAAKDSTLYAWNGAIGTIDTTTTNTITLTGLTVAEQRFDLTGGTLRINGTEYAYTGTSGNQFTGVTPDPSAETGTVSQVVVENANTPGSGLTIDLVDILNNQVYVGDYTSREVFVSSATDYTDFSNISTPREPGEAALLTLDNVPTAFAVQEDVIHVFAGKSDIYRVQVGLTGSTNGYVEDISVKKLKNAPQKAAKQKDLVANINNAVVFVTNEPTLDELGRVENIQTPQSMPLSDPIKPNFDRYDFTGGDITYYKNSIYIALPAEGLVLIRDLANGFWQPPQQLSISKFSVYDGKLIGHSSLVAESYELFGDDQTSDVGNVINMQAVFAYRDFGDRALMKGFDEYYSEGYISSNTELTLTLQYDFEGGTGEKSFLIKGSDDTILSGRGETSGLGSLPLGASTLGSSSETPTDRKKFRQINGTRTEDFHEMRTIYSTTDDDASFEIIAHGPQVRYSPNQNNHITK